MRHPLTLCLLSAALLCGTAQADRLVPPAGYYEPVRQDDGKPERCESVPPPYTDKLVFPSKYSGSDAARATLNVVADKHYRRMTGDIREMEKGVSELVFHYMRHGHREELECSLKWLSTWAEAGALLSDEYNHTGKSMRKWALGSMASAYLKLKFSESQPLAPYKQQTEVIEAWFAKLAEHTVKDWSDLPLKKINNHSYWSAWSVMATAVITDRRDLFDWAVDQYRVAANQVDEQGYLPNELKRKPRALAYHNYSLPPLTMLAAFAQANGVDVRGENDGALQRLVSRVMEGIEEPELFADKAGAEQNLEDLQKKSKFIWLEPYCTLYSCSAQTMEWKASLVPLKSFRLGGDISAVFEPEETEQN
ncbi:mannuronate-specific alginate lyase [Pseudomonas borbori]